LPGPWVSAQDPRWLYTGHAWWRGWLQPGDIRAPLVFAALWLLALPCYWWPRRRQHQVVGLTIVVTMVLIGGVLATALLACRCRKPMPPDDIRG
jgi:hypothetical protein